MTLAKIVVTGKVVKNPEKRFTQNNLAITNLIVDINPQDETLVRVSAIGALADRAAETVQLNDTVIIDGRLQMENVKTTSGKDKKSCNNYGLKHRKNRRIGRCGQFIRSPDAGKK